jgi:glutamate synthase domain-containing protein 1
MRKTQGLYNPLYEHDACGVGFVAQIDGTRSHKIIEEGVKILCNLEHRGAVGGDLKTGDGAGMLLQLPHKFFSKTVDFKLPEQGSYGVGFLFLPGEETERAKTLVEDTLVRENAELLGWRRVPVNSDCLGDLAREKMPSFRQVFVKCNADDGEELERRLYIIRKCIENEAEKAGWDMDSFYIPSFSCRTIIYKGMFVSTQFISFYPDLQDKDFTSALALVHQRYSTNTFPSWPLAQPFRFIAHNGEINTLRRNENNMKARETSLSSDMFGNELAKLLPIANPCASDSANFDNVLELLNMAGRSLEHAMIMMVPEAFGTKYHISQDKRAFFEYHAAIMEPWDGPAAISFSDGIRVGAMLDRNGLRPVRYVITKSGKVVLASEVGVLDFAHEDVLEKGRLAPGKMFLVDLKRKRVIKDNEIKSAISRRKPYRHWLETNRIELKGLLGVPRPVKIDREKLILTRKAFGYTREDLKNIIAPMVENSQEPIGSMGNDTSLAVLSRRPQLLFNYFKQLFAQVTNPPIDPYRENLVMSLMSFVGRERNLLAETPQHCHQLKLSHPILTNDDIEMLKNSRLKDFRVCTVPILFNVREAPGALTQALDQVCREAEMRIDEGHSMIILSDRNISPDMAAIPSLLAISGVHHYLIRKGKRHLSGLFIETGEAREVHHFAALIGYGASGINPYLVFESMIDLKDSAYISGEMTLQEAIEHYITAVKKGLLKIMSKMGISTIRSYRGSQIYEAVGLDRGFIDKYFTGTPSLIGGIGIDVVEKEKLAHHNRAFKDNDSLDSGGIYNYRKFSEHHRFSPEAIVLLQRATRESDYCTSGAGRIYSKAFCYFSHVFRIDQQRGS